MHPASHYHLAQAKIAEFHSEAERARTARSASRARRTPAPQRSHRVRALPAVLARRAHCAGRLPMTGDRAQAYAGPSLPSTTHLGISRPHAGR